MHKIHFLGAPDPAGGAYDAPPNPYSDGEGAPLPALPPSRRFRRLDLKTYRMGGGGDRARDNVLLWQQATTMRVQTLANSRPRSRKRSRNVAVVLVKVKYFGRLQNCLVL